MGNGSLRAFIDNSWIKNYDMTNELWLSDCLNWDRSLDTLNNDISFLTFVLKSSFLDHNILVDQLSKISYLDIILIQANANNMSIQTLFNTVSSDAIINLSTCFLPLAYYLQFEFHDGFTSVAHVSPELISVLEDYTLFYWLVSAINFLPSVVIDSYNISDNYFLYKGVHDFFLFGFYVWILVNLFIYFIPLKWLKNLNSYFIRVYYYFYSISKETRMQFEALFQTIIFFIIYWAVTLMTFDDDQEESIELIDTCFFYIFTLLIFYLIYKYSIHYFAFLEASIVNGKSVSYVVKQFSKDFLNSFSLLLRFYVLLFRLNIYDALDDFLDSYFIFSEDFEDENFSDEIFLSLHGTLFFSTDNSGDSSFLLEDDTDFSFDFFYLYFALWSNFLLFLFFMVEEALRLSLAFYISYLIIFEVHAVNCSYKEDNYFSNKKWKIKL